MARDQLLPHSPTAPRPESPHGRSTESWKNGGAAFLQKSQSILPAAVSQLVAYQTLKLDAILAGLIRIGRAASCGHGDESSSCAVGRLLGAVCDRKPAFDLLQPRSPIPARHGKAIPTKLPRGVSEAYRVSHTRWGWRPVAPGQPLGGQQEGTGVWEAGVTGAEQG